MQRVLVFLLQTVLLITLLAVCAGISLNQRRQQDRLLPARKALVAGLGLTDLAIWTEARYTRHPSQADFFTPFQDAPSSFEHFPAGSLLAPPLARPESRIEVHRRGR